MGWKGRAVESDDEGIDGFEGLGILGPIEVERRSGEQSEGWSRRSSTLGVRVDQGFGRGHTVRLDLEWRFKALEGKGREGRGLL